MNNGFKLSQKESQFKLGLIDNVNKLVQNLEVLKSTDIGIFLVSNKCIDVIYSGVGHNLDLINKFTNKIKLLLIIYTEKKILKIEIMQIMHFTKLRLHFID